MTTGTSPEAVRQQLITDFAQIAAGYEQLRFVRLTAARLVERAALQPGERVLDAGTGTGHAALSAAESGGQNPPFRSPTRRNLRERQRKQQGKSDGFDYRRFSSGHINVHRNMA